MLQIYRHDLINITIKYKKIIDNRYTPFRQNFSSSSLAYLAYPRPCLHILISEVLCVLTGFIFNLFILIYLITSASIPNCMGSIARFLYVNNIILF